MTSLSPDLVLHRASGLKVHIHSSNLIRIALEDKIVTCGPHSLAILDAFYQPVSLTEALNRLSKTSAGVQDWVALTSTIGQLYQAGVLLDETQKGPEVDYGGFGSPSGHIGMLNDRVRTSGFFAGLAEVVTAGDVVVDIGTGTGVLAIAAARAGAKHVYAVEASGIGKMAKAVFEANGLADRITLVQGWSTRITLPERADVLVSEIIGNDPLGEDVLQVTVDARKRLLKPGARLVPSKARIFGLPVTIPHEEQSKRKITKEALEQWRAWYSIDLSPLTQVKDNPFPTFYVRPQRANDWEILSEPILLAELDLEKFKYPISLDDTTIVTANRAGKLNGLLMYFELELGPTTRLSMHPAQADRDNHWGCPVWVVNDPLPLRIGDQFEVIHKFRPGSHTIAVSRA